MKILITGGMGFIGSNIAKRLFEQNHEIFINDYPSMENILNVSGFAYQFVHPARLSECLQTHSFEAIVHLGAISDTTELNSMSIFQSNIELTNILLDKALKDDAFFLYASSASIYGKGQEGFIDSISEDQHTKYKPLNLYAWSKHYIDMEFIRKHLFSSDLRVYGLRFFNIYGRNEKSKKSTASVLSQNLDKIMNGLPIKLFRNSRFSAYPLEAKRDFASVDFVFDIINEIFTSNIKSNIYNVGSGEAISFSEFLSWAYQFYNFAPQFDFIEIPSDLLPRYQFFTCADRHNFQSNFPKTLYQGSKTMLINYLSSLK